MKQKFEFIKGILQKEQELKRREEALKQIGLKFDYKEPKNQESSFLTLIHLFHFASSYEEKMRIAQEIERIRGSLPIDIQMELDYLEMNRSR